MIDPTQMVELATSDDYAAPAREGQALPLVYGDCSGARPFLEPVCLDTTAYIYGLAGHQVASVAQGQALTIFDADGAAISGALYTFNPAHDLEGAGVIATATFADDPAELEPITASLKGKVDADGSLITNPLELLSDQVDADDLDAAAWARAWARAEALGYRAAGAVVRETSLGDLLTALMASFLGSWWLGGDGRLQAHLDWGAGSLQEAELAYRLAGRDLAQVSARLKLSEVANQVGARHSYSHVEGDYMEEYSGGDSRDSASIGRHGLRSHTLELPWVRSAAVARTVCSRLVGMVGRPRAQISCQESGLGALILERGDAALLSVDWLCDPDGRPLANQIVRVLGVEPDLDKGSVRLSLLDTGYYKTIARRADGTHPADGSIKAGGERDRRAA